MMMFGFGWLMMLVMLVGLLLGVIVLVLLIWVLVRWLQRSQLGSSSPAVPAQVGPPGAHESQPTPVDVLRQRYARGEIDTATFEEMQRRLEGRENTLDHERT